MSERTIEFFWDVVSPYTYLASTRIDRVGRECGVPVRWRPFLLGGVFRRTGNRPPAEVPAKFAYILDDLKTWASYYKVSFRFPESFPLNSLMPMRAAVFADRSGKGHEFALAMMQAYCLEEDSHEPTGGCGKFLCVVGGQAGSRHPGEPTGGEAGEAIGTL